MTIWNPWHGCKKFSSGCKNCYVYRRDESIGKDSSLVQKTSSFDLPVIKKKDGRYKLTASDGDVYTCMTSDFFIDEADQWRDEIWEMIRKRSDLNFIIITKRIERAEKCLPPDWGEGYDNVELMCTCENQQETDKRMPVFLNFPAKKRSVICEPFLEEIDMSAYLDNKKIKKVCVGGESGENARVCDFEWVSSLREQCRAADVSFSFRQTGSLFRKNGKLYHIDRKYHHSQARKAGIDYIGSYERNFDDIIERLSKSVFRSKFELKQEDIRYYNKHGKSVIREHAYDFIINRISSAEPYNDGNQTPVKGHPVFIAQHACGCCCRSCLEKWHYIPPGREMTMQEVDRIVALIMKWISLRIYDP